jgi:hypothetical protein
MNKSKIVLAGIVLAVVFGMVACKRSGPPPDNVKVTDVSAPEIKATTPVDDKTPEYVKDLRKDVQKARDAGVKEQNATEAEAKATEEATK